MASTKRLRKRRMTPPVQGEVEAVPSARVMAIGRFAGPAVIILATVYMLYVSWRKWPDVLVDYGRELYIPWQLSEGKVLYRDLAYFLGPLSPYVNSLWFRLFGVSLQTLVMCSIVILGIQIAVLYKLLALIGNRFSATVGVLVFAFVFACSKLVGIANYNFICPYTYEAVHGMVLSSTAILCFCLYAHRGQWPYLTGSALALGLAFLTRAEPCLAAALAITLGMTLMLALRPSPRDMTGARMALFFGTASLPPMIAFALLCLAMPAGQAASGVLGPWLSSLNPELTGLRFFQAGMGLLDPGANFGAMVAWCGRYALFFVPLAVVSLVLGKVRRHRTPIALACFVLVALALARVGSGADWLPFWFQAGRPLPLIMALIAGVCLILLLRAGRNGECPPRLISQLVVTVFALGMLLKMILNVRFSHYGFTLAMPATLVLVVTIVNWIPAVIKRIGGNGTAFAAAASAVILVWLGAVHSVVLKSYEAKVNPIGSGADSFLAGGRGVPARQILAEIAERVGPEQTLAVFPEGVMLNYLSRRANPTPYTGFMPTEVAVFGEDRILRAFIEDPPDWVALVHKDTSEFGYRFFGTHYGQSIGAWIAKNYRPVAQVGAPPLRDRQFGIMLLQQGQPD